MWWLHIHVDVELVSNWRQFISNWLLMCIIPTLYVYRKNFCSFRNHRKPSTISQFLDLIHWMVFDFIFYCVTMHTLYMVYIFQHIDPITAQYPVVQPPSRLAPNLSCTSQIDASTSPPPPEQPPGIWIFGKFLFKFPPHWVEKLFKCPHPRENYQIIVSTFQ